MAKSYEQWNLLFHFSGGNIELEGLSEAKHSMVKLEEYQGDVIPGIVT